MEKTIKKSLAIAAIAGIIVLILTNYTYFDSRLENFIEEAEKAKVKRVIDGDTVVIKSIKNQSQEKTIRLLGINCPETNELFYEESSNYLKERILNKTITLKYGNEKKDLYGRYLAYIYLGRKNINKEMIEEGYANPYFPKGKTEKYEEFYKTWKECVSKDKNYCKNSEDKCSGCIELTDIDTKNQKIILKNNCNFKCNLSRWQIKDEGRKKFIFPNNTFLNSQEKLNLIVSSKNKTKEAKQNEKNIIWERDSYVWTKSGDGIFLRDSNKKLVLWENYLS